MLLSGVAAGRTRKRSIALVIEEPEGPGAPAGGVAAPAEEAIGEGTPTGGGVPLDRRRWLLVQRPLDDADLPGEWGLPAGTLEPGETEEALIRRIGRQKLGVALRPDRALVAGRTERPAYGLEMTLWAATIESGTIEVPRPDPGVTQYREWGWRPPADLGAGARHGSLCCRLGLEWAADGRGGRPGSGGATNPSPGTRRDA